MKKIGIITFHKAFNYGAILQAYALSKSISLLNFDCEIIDVLDPVQSSKKTSFKRKLILFARSLIYCDRTIKYKKRCRKINKFVKFNLPLSKEKYNALNIANSNFKYDVFVVGSDQVWNLSFKNNHIYLLDFADQNKFKISYAASFGYSQVPNKYLEHSKESIKKFNAISVRENSGLSILTKQLGILNGTLVVDPTLLINKESWVKNIDLMQVKDKRVKKAQKIVLYYAVAPQTKLLNLATKTAQNKNMKLVILNNSTEIKVKGALNFYEAGIEDFIYLFNKASYVFTTSFHGLAFAINFNKQFVFEVSKEKSNANDRLLSLTNELGLAEREIEVIHDVDQPINWGCVNDRLENLRKRSIQFLSENLNDCKQ